MTGHGNGSKKAKSCRIRSTTSHLSDPYMEPLQTERHLIQTSRSSAVVGGMVEMSGMVETKAIYDSAKSTISSSVHNADCFPSKEPEYENSSGCFLDTDPCISLTATPCPPAEDKCRSQVDCENGQPDVPEWVKEATLHWTKIARKYRQRSPWNVLTLYIISKKNFKAGKLPPGVSTKEYTATVLSALKSDPMLENSIDDKGQGFFWLSAAGSMQSRPGPPSPRASAAPRGFDRSALLAHAGAEPCAPPLTYAQMSGIEGDGGALAGFSDDDADSDHRSSLVLSNLAAGGHWQEPAMWNGAPGPDGHPVLAGTRTPAPRGSTDSAPEPAQALPQAPTRRRAYCPSQALDGAADSRAVTDAGAPPACVLTASGSVAVSSTVAGEQEDSARVPEGELLRYFLSRDKGAPALERGCALADRAGAARMKEAALLGTLEGEPDEENEELDKNYRFPWQRSSPVPLPKILLTLPSSLASLPLCTNRAK